MSEDKIKPTFVIELDAGMDALPAGTVWEFLHDDFNMEMLGFIPGWLSNDDPDPPEKQIDKNYSHGGGWRPMSSKEWGVDRETYTIQYPEDPPLLPLAKTKVHDDIVVFYPYAFVGVFRPDGTYEIARVD